MARGKGLIGAKKVAAYGYAARRFARKNDISGIRCLGMFIAFPYDIVFRDAYWSLCKLPTISFFGIHDTWSRRPFERETNGYWRCPISDRSRQNTKNSKICLLFSCDMFLLRVLGIVKKSNNWE